VVVEEVLEEVEEVRTVYLAYTAQSCMHKNEPA